MKYIIKPKWNESFIFSGTLSAAKDIARDSEANEIEREHDGKKWRTLHGISWHLVN